MKRTSTLLILGIFIVLAVGAYTGYQYWKQASGQEDLKRVEANLTEYQNKMLQFESKEVLEAINAKKTLTQLEDDIIEWSKVIKKIRKTIPKESGDTIVEVTSYSGASSNEISMNVKTYPDRDEPYFDVADLIKTFDESTSFSKNFVPSISSGVDEDGMEILTFLFGTKYMEDDPLALLEEAAEEAVVERAVEVVEEEVEEVVEEEADEEAVEEEVEEESEAILR